MIRTHIQRYSSSTTNLMSVVLVDINGKVIGGLMMFSDDNTPMHVINNLV